MRLLLAVTIVMAALAAANETYPQQPIRLPRIVLVIPGPAEANTALARRQRLPRSGTSRARGSH